MKKKMLLSCAIIAMCIQWAFAAPVGWYSLNETWRDGSFNGQFFYDNAVPGKITQISGTLTDIAQSTRIDTIWDGEKPDGATWIFVDNAPIGDPDSYDAGFYLNLVDAETSLTLDLAADNGLYDWSNDFIFFEPGQLNGSPLRSFDITPVVPVPEPSAPALVSGGLLACWFSRRRKTFIR